MSLIKRYKDFLFEYFKDNPDLPQIEEINEFIKKYGKVNIYASFRSGMDEKTNWISYINPNNEFETPVGYYTYPMTFLYENLSNKIECNFKSELMVEENLSIFKGLQSWNFLHLLAIKKEYKSKILKSGDSKDKILKYYKKLLDYLYNNYDKLSDKIKNEIIKKEEWINENYDIENNFLKFTEILPSYFYSDKTWTAKLYNIIYYISLNNQNFYNDIDKKDNKETYIFRKLCLNIGIYGFESKLADYFIHENEKVQAVLFLPQKMLENELILNKIKKIKEKDKTTFIRKFEEFDNINMSSLINCLEKPSYFNLLFKIKGLNVNHFYEKFNEVIKNKEDINKLIDYYSYPNRVHLNVYKKELDYYIEHYDKLTNLIPYYFMDLYPKINSVYNHENEELFLNENVIEYLNSQRINNFSLFFIENYNIFLKYRNYIKNISNIQKIILLFDDFNRIKQNVNSRLKYKNIELNDKLFDYINKNIDILEFYDKSYYIIFDYINYNENKLKIFRNFKNKNIKYLDIYIDIENNFKFLDYIMNNINKINTNEDVIPLYKNYENDHS